MQFSDKEENYRLILIFGPPLRTINRGKDLAEWKNGATFVPGKLAEWSIAAVLKTVEPQGSGGSNPSLSARTGDGLQIRFATRFVFSPKLCVRCFESCQAVRLLKTSPRTWVHPGRFRGAWAAEWSCFICTNRRTEVVSAVLGPMGEEIAGPVSDTLRHDLLLKLNILL